MKHATIVTVIDRVAADAPRCCIAQVRALLNRVRAHHRREQATPRIDARSRIGNDSDPWSPSLHDVHVAELEASVLVDSASAPALSEAEMRHDDPRELARARLIFALTWLVPLMLVSAILVFAGAALGQALGSLLRFSVVIMAVPLAGSLVAVLVRRLQRKRAKLSRAASKRD